MHLRPLLSSLALASLFASVPAWSAATPVAPAAAATSLQTNLDGAWRSPENRARDQWRHPSETLTFFGIRADQRVIEITPGAGWYSEILAPLLQTKGHYVVAIQAPASGAYFQKAAQGLQAKFAADPARYGKAEWLEFEPKTPVFGPADSADAVLTFRNVHNWVMADTAPQFFSAFFRVLKPGGVLGVVDHRAKDGAQLEAIKASGYLPTDYVIKLAKDAGFVLDASSEINANPKDSKDYTVGVWALPPVLRLGEQDRGRYQAIGESDRFTLRFVKP